MVDQALEGASSGIVILEQARDMFFKESDDSEPGFFSKAMTKIKSWFNFNHSQMEDNAHFNGRDMSQERKLIRQTLMRMEKMTTEKERRHFILVEVMGME